MQVIVFMCAFPVPQGREPGTLGTRLLPIERHLLPIYS